MHSTNKLKDLLRDSEGGFSPVTRDDATGLIKTAVAGESPARIFDVIRRDELISGALIFISPQQLSVYAVAAVR